MDLCAHGNSLGCLKCWDEYETLLETIAKENDDAGDK